MATLLNAYLGFRDNASEAMDFYHSIFGGELQKSTFAELNAQRDPSEADLIMHSMLRSPNGLVLMASDTPVSMGFKPHAGFSLSLSGEASDEQELRGYWDKLSDGGTVTMPLAQAMWGDTFGMLTDRFGIDWMVSIAVEAD